MKKSREPLKIFLTVLVSVFLVSVAVKAGSLNPSAVPSNDGTRMYALEQIYQVVAGSVETKPDKPTGGFNSPGADTAATMYCFNHRHLSVR